MASLRSRPICRQVPQGPVAITPHQDATAPESEALFGTEAIYEARSQIPVHRNGQRTDMP